MFLKDFEIRIFNVGKLVIKAIIFFIHLNTLMTNYGFNMARLK